MRSMKEKLKRNISLVLTFALVLGMFTHLSVYTDVAGEPITVEAATLPTHSSNTCPYDGTPHQNVGMAICAGCGGYSSSNLVECAWVNCPVSGIHYAVGGRMYLGNGELNQWPNADAEKLIGTFEISNHRAPGYNKKKNTSPGDGCSYHIDYYACYNCVGGQDNSHKYDDVRIMWTEHYFSDGTLVNTTYDEDYGTSVTSVQSNGSKYTFELKPGEGVVQLTWCSYCGPLIWEENGYPKDNPNSDKDIINVGDAGIQPCVVDELKEKTLHINKKYTLTLSAKNGGKVSLDGETWETVIQEKFYSGEKVKVYAKANENYGFDKWTNSSNTSVSTSTETTITMPSNSYTLYANFKQTAEKYKFTIKANGHGSVNDEINGEYIEGTDLSINAIPDTGYVFTGWTGEGWSNASSVEALGPSDNFTMPEPTNKAIGIILTAGFGEPTPTPIPKYKINLSLCEGCADCDGADSSQYSIGYVGFSSKTVEKGTKVTITANTKQHYEFSHWTNSLGSDKPAESSKEVEVKQDQNWIAHFKCKQYVVKVETGYGGSVNESEVNNQTYTHKDTVTFKATPDEGYSFSWWHNPSNKLQMYSTDAETSITVTKDIAYKALFAKKKYQVTAEVEPAGAGTVAGAGKSYGWDSEVSLTVSANAGYKFVGWTSGDVTVSADGKFTMPKKDVTVTAKFEASGEAVDPNATYEVTVYAQPLGAGSATGAGSYKAGESISIVPTALDGYVVSGYKVTFNKNSSEYSAEDYPAGYTLTMPTYDVTVTVIFTESTIVPGETPVPTKAPITVTFDPDGGTVNPASKKVYPDGTYGTLPVPKKTGYSFLYWVYQAGDGDSMVDAGTQVQCETDHTLVAEYEENIPDATPTPEATPEPTPEPTAVPEHVCEFDPWSYDETKHWKECIAEECEKISEEGYHDFESGAPDETGQVTKTCKDCGYTVTGHKHDWQKWYPTYPYWEDYGILFTNDWLSDWELEQFPYDADTYHWQTCSYESCGKSTARMTHTKGELVDEGDGYQRARCTICGWVMEEIPLKVNLTINPNGGTFPDGSTERITFTDIAYGEVTELAVLGSEYFPVRNDPEKGTMSFLGYYIVEENLEDCMYAPDYDTNTSIGSSRYFGTKSNGTRTSLMTRDYTVHAQWGVAEYSVIYDKNEDGATGKMSATRFEVGQEKALSGIGYSFTSNLTYNTGDVPAVVAATFDNTTVYASFLGWAKTADGAVAYNDKQKVKNLLDRPGVVTLYAKWDFGSIILPNATATDGGQKLSGWKKTDGTFISVLDAAGNYKQVVYPVHGDETLTAVWVPNTYKVSFDSDGGTACNPIHVTYRRTYNYGNSGLPATTKAGYTFKGWKHALTAETITNNSIVTTAADHTLAAVWEPLKVTVALDYNFNFNGTAVNAKKNTGSLDAAWTAVDESTDKRKLSYGEMLGTLPSPTMEGYQFAGWYMEEDTEGNGCGENVCIVSGSSRVNKTTDYTIHARWSENQYKVNLDPNDEYSVWED